jgi:ribosome biogenesis GTPase A
LGEETVNADDAVKVSESRVLVVGGIGHGKSSFINTVLGEDKCTSGDTWAVDKTITKDLEEVELKRKGDIITFIDTPSLKTLKSSSKFLDLYKTGFHAIVIVYSIKSFTHPTPSVLQEVRKLFGDDLFRYALIILTFEDYLGDSTVDEFLNANTELKDFVKRTSDKPVAVCNTVEKNSTEANEQRARCLVYLESVLRKNEEPLKEPGKCSCCWKCVSWFLGSKNS